VVRTSGALSNTPRKGEGPEAGEHQHQGDHEADVADPIDHKCLLGRSRRRGAGEPEPDEEVRAQAHQLPSEEEHRVVPGEDQREHRRSKQVEVGEEPGKTLVTVHVADGEDMNQGPYPGHHERHQRRKRVPLNLEAGADRRHPLPDQHRRCLSSPFDERKRCHEGEDERCANRGGGEPSGKGLTQVPADEVEQDRSQQRQGDDQPDEVDHRLNLSSR
jgi:hypothetical protein